MLSAYGDFTRLPLHLNEGYHRVNVRCIVVPKGCYVYGAILVNMFLFALDRRQPAYIMMISGDRNFSHTLNRLGHRRYTVILSIPSRVGVSKLLRYAGSFVWDWPSLAKTSRSYSYSNSLNEVSLPHVSSNEQNDSMWVQPGEKVIKAVKIYNLRKRNSNSLNEVSLRHVSSNEQNDSMRVQPCDVKGLRRNLVPPLESSAGQLPLDEIKSEGRIYNLRKRKR
nr:hypothetical protein [Tanacetum cinerariifolium]